MKLNNEVLAQLPASIVRPVYDRSQIQQGIVHIGVGGFHRSHQAFYTEQLLNQETANDWGICGIGLRIKDEILKAALVEQDFLYSLSELGGEEASTQVIGAISDILLASDGAEAIIDKLADPLTRIVSLTITEKGYCVDYKTGDFLVSTPEIRHDLDSSVLPVTWFGYLAAGLRRRMESGIKPLTIISCDNLPYNGDLTRKALLAFTGLQDRELSRWIEQNVSFPNSMVDRITPVTTTEHKRLLKKKQGIEDAWPVMAEPFKQWVIEDKFVNGRPAWETVGVQLTESITPYETMKAQLLDGAYHVLSCLGLLFGYTQTCEVLSESDVYAFVGEYLDKDIMPTLEKPQGVDTDGYKDNLKVRLLRATTTGRIGGMNQSLCLRLPANVLFMLNKQIILGLPLDRIAFVFAAWAVCLNKMDENIPQPPLSDLDEPLPSRQVKSSEHITGLLAFNNQLDVQLPESSFFIEAFDKHVKRIQARGVRAALSLVLSDVE